ncbi:hypothetical protein ACIP98_32045 [Streptomyces sp. NPDC088354]|nr:hypothetical protein [Streptomyces sp. MI02-7b]MDX3076703.1 hypothetical protein [Streptomyces sp. MI02-7b]
MIAIGSSMMSLITMLAVPREAAPKLSVEAAPKLSVEATNRH